MSSTDSTAQPPENEPGQSRTAPGTIASHGAPDTPRPSFPVAAIREAGSTTSSLLKTSPMWWATLACVVVAFWLTWRSMPTNGPTVVIRFPEGHGLKSGDAMRHRGIDVGTVTDVTLSSDLSQIAATVTLTPGAADLAREGTRFWIVRPQLSLAGVSGLETAVGGKYIAVAPAEEPGGLQKSFDGLAAAPADEHSGDGIDIILRSDSKHGVNTGSPVTWRGVDVGQVLSTNLSPDARFVDIHARINAEYRRLLRPSSRFWVTSGLGVDVGLSGLKLNADSLTTIVRGGVSFATLATSRDRTPIQAGHMFDLHAKPDPAWLSAAASLPLIEFSLPSTITITGMRKSSILGISRSREFTVNGILVTSEKGDPQLLTAADVVTTAISSSSRESGPDGAPVLTVGAAESRASHPVTLTRANRSTANAASTVVGNPVDSGSAQPKSSDNAAAAGAESELVTSELNSGLAWFTASAALPELPTISRQLLRIPSVPEECCICRSVKSDDEASAVIQCFSQSQLQATPGDWSVTSDLGDMSAWHGAPVVAMSDGKIIGVFVVAKQGPSVATLKSDR